MPTPPRGAGVELTGAAASTGAASDLAPTRAARGGQSIGRLMKRGDDGSCIPCRPGHGPCEPGAREQRPRLTRREVTRADQNCRYARVRIGSGGP